MKRLLPLLGMLLAGCASTPPTGVAPCFDRRHGSHLSQVDSHLHARPFSGAAVPHAELLDWLRRAGVHHANVYGIGQTLPADSPCQRGQDCAANSPVRPTLKNDFINAQQLLEQPSTDPQLLLAMSFPDLAAPQHIRPHMALLDAEFPGLFRWMGEVNLVKQALFRHGYPAVDTRELAAWDAFMAELRQRNMPLSLHSDLGDDDAPLRYLPQLEAVLARYPDNLIVWQHLGLSYEQRQLDPQLHIATLERLLARYPRLWLDISWRVVNDHYFARARDAYVAFLNRHAARVLTGSDFVAYAGRRYQDYLAELAASSDINQYLDDAAFRYIALGQSYFDLLRLPQQAAAICRR